MLDKDPTTEQHPSPTVGLLIQLSITDETGKTDKLSRVSLRPDVHSVRCIAVWQRPEEGKPREHLESTLRV